MILTNLASGTPISLGDAGLTVVLGMLVTFVGLGLLLAVMVIMAKIATRKKVQTLEPALETVNPVPVTPVPAPGTAGKVKLYDVPDREAAMIMAIVANRMNRPLNELRFLSIKEVHEL